MKHIATSVVCLLFGLRIFANPIELPSINISELYFDSLGKWVLELEYNAINQKQFPIDSIVLFSSEDTVKLKTIDFNENMGVFIVREDSLASDFNINRYGDVLTVQTFIWSGNVGNGDDILTFGNYNGAVINYPRSGQSITKYRHFFVKNNSPSLGDINDTTGIFGTLTGTIYDKNFIPVSKQKFEIDYRMSQFETLENGSFILRAFSALSTFKNISYQIKQYTWGSVDIDEISYEMEPDSVIIRDIYLLDTLQTGLTDILINCFPIKLYPNPLSFSDQLHFEIDLPVKTATCRIEVLNLDGKLLMTRRITEKKGEIKLGDLKGMLIVNVLMDSKLVSTSRIMAAND